MTLGQIKDRGHRIVVCHSNIPTTTVTGWCGSRAAPRAARSAHAADMIDLVEIVEDRPVATDKAVVTPTALEDIHGSWRGQPDRSGDRRGVSDLALPQPELDRILQVRSPLRPFQV